MTIRSLAFALAAAAAIASPAGLRADDNHVKGAKPLHISQGQEVRLEDYLVPGKVTIFDFYSEFCPPCRALGPRLEQLHESRADIAVVKVDINRPDVRGIDWKSPVSLEFKLHSIPHLSVYDASGAHKEDLDGKDVWTAVDGWSQP